MEQKKQKRASYLALMICPAITFYLFDMYTHNPFTAMNTRTQVLNIIFYQLMSLMLLGIFKYVRLALMIQSGIFMLVGLVNYYVQSFRSAPIRPWDIFSVGTAAGVADNYDYSLKAETVGILLCFLILFLVESRFRGKVPTGMRKRMLLVVLPFLLLCSYTRMVQSDRFVLQFGLYDKFFTPTVVNKRDGNIVAFLMAMEYMDVEKPKDYSAENARQLLSQNEPAEEAMAAGGSGQETDRPNIIVIMDEAFSDLSVLGEVATNQDYMPFIHSLQKGADNTVTGTLNVSVLGGNTANTEFEFLTGNTMAFLPQGSVAYQQYVQKEMPSLASHLRELGYTTVAMHPYGAKGWDRSRVYPLLGFERFLSANDFKGAEKLRSYVSDRACFDRVIELYEEKEEGEPLFVFNVTMQNHGGYTETFDNFTPTVSVDNVTTRALPAYFSLLKETDSAFEELIAYFETVQEDTMIVFFGDHQPAASVSNSILKNNGTDPGSLSEEENLLRYKVPYVIWSNFDIEEETERETSANYLMMDVLENCKLPLPAFQNCMKELREEYPVISAMQVRDRKGNYLTADACEEELEEYRSLAYYLLFDYEETKSKRMVR